MKQLATALIFLFATQTAQAQEQSIPVTLNDTGAGQSIESTFQQEQATWPSPFHPSQEIGADSQVSFPADI